jgi:uncharacterized protein YecE (DUF72 family)
MIYLGTSGYYYDDWVGPVYPQDLAKRDWLPFYASTFRTVEMNVTYYRVPSLRMVRGWVERTPEDFLFSLKANRELTHERKDPDFEPFVASLEPLREAGRLACVLAQFPYSFKPSAESRDYLLDLRSGLGDLPVVVEFRNHGWVEEGTFDLLQELEFGFCCVDEPRMRGLMPPIAKVTGPMAYVRFHGRNAAKWWQHDHAWERYDYTYSEEELREWVPRIRQLDQQAPLTLVYANNHYRGQSVDTVRKLGNLLAPASG